jgi:hypothetical protein
MDLDLDYNYRIATSDFVFKGGDNILAGIETTLIDTTSAITDIFIDFLKQKKIIDSRIEGRVVKVA